MSGRSRRKPNTSAVESPESDEKASCANRSFSTQALDRFNVLHGETVRHIHALLTTFGASKEQHARLAHQFSRAYRVAQSTLIAKIEEKETSHPNGNWGQNPKEKWGMFQGHVDRMVRTLYEFIEWCSQEISPHDGVGRAYCTAELLDGIFGAVWSSKQGLKHIWNKGILDDKQDFFCLRKVLNRFPQLEEYCDDVSSRRIGPNKSSSWTEVIQDLRNIRVHTVGAYLRRVSTSSSADGIQTTLVTSRSAPIHPKREPTMMPPPLQGPSPIPLCVVQPALPVHAPVLMPSLLTMQTQTQMPMPMRQTPQYGGGGMSVSMQYGGEGLATDRSMEDVSTNVPGNSCPAPFWAPFGSLVDPNGNASATPIAPFYQNSGTHGMNANFQNSPPSYAIEQGSQEFLHYSPSRFNGYLAGSFQPDPEPRAISPRDLSLFGQAGNDLDGFNEDFDMDEPFDDAGCIFDGKVGCRVLLTSFERLKLGSLAAHGIVSNGSMG